MRKNKMILLGAAAVLLVILIVLLIFSCKITKTSPKKVADLDYTVVEDQNIPQELKKLIDEKKGNNMRLTYTADDYIFLVAGYGAQKTGGYSIKVNELYLGENSIYVNTNLIGPAKGEKISEQESYPFIVIKIQRREEPVVFNIS